MNVMINGVLLLLRKASTVCEQFKTGSNAEASIQEEIQYIIDQAIESIEDILLEELDHE